VEGIAAFVDGPGLKEFTTLADRPPPETGIEEFVPLVDVLAANNKLAGVVS
jgi:hypothetical protein